MTFKKLCSAVLAAAMVLALGMPASAASSYTPGHLVDENGYSVDHDTLSPGETYYYVIGSTAQYGILTDRDYVSFSLKKTSNSKYITDADLVEKNFGSGRMVCIRLVVKDYFTDDEYKVQMEANFRARKDLDIVNSADVAAGREFPQFVPKGQKPVALAARSSATDTYNSAADALEKAKQELATLNSELATLASKLGEAPPYKADNDKLAVAHKNFQDALSKVQSLQTQVNQQAAVVRDLEANTIPSTLSPEKVAELNNIKSGLAAHTESVKAQLRALGVLPDNNYATSTDPLDAQKLLPYYNTGVAPTQIKDSGPPLPVTFTNWNNYRAQYLLSYPGDTTAIPMLQLGNFTYTDATGVQKAAFDNRAAVQAALVNLRTSLINTINSNNAQIANINGQLNGTIPTPTPRAASPALTASKAELARLQAAKTAADAVANNANLAFQNRDNFNRKAGELSIKEAAVKTLQYDYDVAKAELEAQVADKPGVGYLNSGQTFTHHFSIWIGNETIESDDADFDVGQSGQVIRPVKGAVNTVRWNDGYGMVASVRFTADSDASFFFPRLSTRWDNADYYDYFEDQDAYIFEFSGNPTLPATSRAELQLRNPYVDENGHSSIRSRDIVVYQIVKGELNDVTRLFNPTVNDDGISVLSTRTRTLGTYVVCEEEVYFDYDDDDDFDDDDIEVLDPSSPVIPAVDINNNQKPVPNTGR